MDNFDRTMSAERALEQHERIHDESIQIADYNYGDRGVALRDLLSNLMHWADQNGIDFLDGLRIAQVNYDAEANYDPDVDHTPEWHAGPIKWDGHHDSNGNKERIAELEAELEKYENLECPECGMYIWLEEENE